MPAGAVLATASAGVVGGLGTDDQFRDEGLHEARGLLGGCFGDALDPFDECGLCAYPPEPTARCDRLGEGVEPDDAPFGVDGEVGGHEGVEEGVAGGGGRVVV